MKIFSIALAIIALSGTVNAQITFQKTIGGANFDRGYSVQQTSDGGYIITGSYSAPFAVFSDVYLVKTDSLGNLLWTKSFGGLSNDVGRFVQQTFDGGYIIVGTTYSFGAGNEDIYLIRTDANGNSLWTKTFGGSNGDEGFFVQQTTDSGYIFTGRTYSFPPGYSDVYLVKTDENGDTLWTKTFGGAHNDEGYCVRQIPGGYIIGGTTMSFGAGSYDILLIKTDIIGNPLWANTYGGTAYDGCSSAEQTSDGGFIITGKEFSFGAGVANAYLLKTDTNGNQLWAKTFGGTDEDGGLDVHETTDGGFIIFGFTSSFNSSSGDIYLIKTDLNGDTIWTKTCGGVDYESVARGQQTADGGYIITGESSGFGAPDVYLIKTDSNGNTGCYEQSPATITSIPAMQIAAAAIIAAPSPAIITSPGTVVDTGGVVTLLCLDLGKNEPTPGNEFTVYPNPSSGTFIVSSSTLIKKGMITLFNPLGEIAEEINISNESMIEVKVNNSSQGLYFVKVFDGERSYCKKLFLE